MAQLPQWNGEPFPAARAVETTSEAFTVVHDFMAGGRSANGFTKDEVIHLAEAAAIVNMMCEYASSVALPIAREKGASLAELSAATALPRSTLQTKKYRRWFGEDVD